MQLFDEAPAIATSKYVLRPYQEEAVQAGVDFFSEDHPGHGIMVEPTGCGKSLLIANIIARTGRDTLVFQPSREILVQNHQKLTDYGYYAATFSAGMKQKKLARVTLGTIGTVINQWRLFTRFRQIIIDECHKVDAHGGMYKTFIQNLSQFNEVKVLGLTATPYRLTSDRFNGAINKFITRTDPKVFSKVIHYTQCSTLFEQGYLCPMQYYPIPGFNRRNLKANTKGSEFTDKSVEAEMKRIGFDQVLLRLVRDRLLGPSRKTGLPLRRNVLVFTKFVWEAQALVNALGPYAAVVSADTPDGERNRIIRDFRNGTIRVIANVGVLTTGFDYPELECIVLARPTMSLALYYQMIGRGVRPHENKDHCKVVDLCDNISLFGHIEDLTLKAEGVKNDLWYFESNGRRLTNIGFGQR